MGAGGRVLARVLTWPVAPACLLAIPLVGSADPGPSHVLVTGSDLPYLTAMVATWTVGVVLTGRRPAPTAGWAFLALGSAMAASGLIDEYADLAVFRRPGLPLPGVAATLSDSSWVWWFVLVALVLVLTPPASVRGRHIARLPTATLVAGATYQVAALLRPVHLDAPYHAVVSPWALPGRLGDVASAVAFVSVSAVGLCVVGSVVGLVLAWRRSGGDVRQQLLWLVAGGLAVGVCVVASFAVSFAGRADVAGVVMSLAIICLAIGAALSVLRYKLYAVERVVTDSAGYAAAAAAVVGVFLLVLAMVNRTTPADASAQLPTALATLVAVGVARSVYVWARRAAERRVNRDRFDAVETVRTGLANSPGDLELLLQDALGDPGARLLYPAEDGSWTTVAGHPATPVASSVDIRRAGEVTAILEFDASRVARDVVEAVAHVAGPEIDNVALRAEVARQLAQVSRSRARLATAHLDERRRLERDLHDGAQQRLLALALQLQSARVNGGRETLIAEVDRAIDELGRTVRDLRDLAGGLQPAALAGGGLLGAVVDMVGRVPVSIRHEVVNRRFSPEVESAAWFVISEAVTNVVKHAATDAAEVTVTADRGRVQVVVVDDGVGGADPAGHGAQGLADRVAALGGTLSISERAPHGTKVEAVLPCAS
jgi:signal transduction histidine kinase